MALHRCPAGLSAIAACAIAALAFPARAQDIEPRAYSNAPIGVNFLVAGYAYTRGGLAFDSAVPITNPDLRTSSAVVGLRDRAGSVGEVGQVRRDRALHVALGDGRLQGGAGRAQGRRLREPGLSAVGQSLRGARTDAEGIRRLGAGPDRRRQPAGVRPVEPVRQHQARQHRHQPLGVQAGDRHLESTSDRGRRRSRRRPSSSPTTTTSSAATRCRRTRSTRSRGT